MPGSQDDILNTVWVVPKPPNNDWDVPSEEILGWLKSLSDDEVQAGYQHHFDQWNWDSGCNVDQHIYKLFEAEKERRRLQAEALTVKLEQLGQQMKRLEEEAGEPADEDTEEARRWMMEKLLKEKMK